MFEGAGRAGTHESGRTNFLNSSPASEGCLADTRPMGLRVCGTKAARRLQTMRLSPHANPGAAAKGLIPARLIVVEPNALEKGGRIPEGHTDSVVIVESAEDALARVLQRILRHSKNLRASGRKISEALLVCASAEQDRQSARLSLGAMLLDLLEEEGATLRVVATRRDPAFADSLFGLAEQLLTGRHGAASVRLEFPVGDVSKPPDAAAHVPDAGLLGSAA